MPSSATEGAMIKQRRVLIAGEFAVFTEGSEMKPITVGVEVVLNVVFIPLNLVLFANVLSLAPSFGFDAKQVNVARVIVASE